jgi:hypothetical protein
MMMFSALSVIPLLLLLVLPVVVRHCSSNLIDDAIDFINKAKNKMCETMYINRKSFNVSGFVLFE